MCGCMGDVLGVCKGVWCGWAEEAEVIVCVKVGGG